MATKIGEKVRALRKARGLSLEALAQAASMSKSYLWELENREGLNLTTEKLAAIAEAFSLPITYFLDDSVDTPQESHLDQAFFRNYAKLDPSHKAVMQDLVKSFLNKTPRSSN